MAGGDTNTFEVHVNDSNPAQELNDLIEQILARTRVTRLRGNETLSEGQQSREPRPLILVGNVPPEDLSYLDNQLGSLGPSPRGELLPLEPRMDPSLLLDCTVHSEYSEPLKKKQRKARKKEEKMRRKECERKIKKIAQEMKDKERLLRKTKNVRWLGIFGGEDESDRHERLVRKEHMKWEMAKVKIRHRREREKLKEMGERMFAPGVGLIHAKPDEVNIEKTI